MLHSTRTSAHVHTTHAQQVCAKTKPVCVQASNQLPPKPLMLLSHSHGGHADRRDVTFCKVHSVCPDVGDTRAPLTTFLAGML